MDQKQIEGIKHRDALLVAIGAALGGVRNNPHDAGRAFVLVPQADGSAKIEYLEAPATPVRAKGQHVVHDVAGFIDMVDRHLNKAEAVIYAQLQPAQLTCVLNDHLASRKPGWRDHRVHFTMAHSVEFQAWAAGERSPMPQMKFAEFIEDNLGDFVTPAGAKMYEIALNVKAKAQASFKSGIHQQNGTVQFEFTEQVEASAGRAGRFDIPEQMKINIPVWAGVGQKRYDLNARLRYKIGNGAITFTFHLDRAQRVVEEAFLDILDRVRKELKEVPVVYGQP